MTQDEYLDRAPLTFGKYKGRTPDEISKTKDGSQYIVWMFENVTNKPTCSRLLYEDCGGAKLKRDPVEDDILLGEANEEGYPEDEDDIPF